MATRRTFFFFSGESPELPPTPSASSWEDQKCHDMLPTKGGTGGSWWDVAQDSTGYIVLEINNCGYCGGFHKYIAGWFSEESKITCRIWGYPHRKAPYLDSATDHNCELMFLSARSSLDGCSKDALWQSAPWSMTEKPG